MTGSGSAAEIAFVSRKYDGSLHWHSTMIRLGEDEHGVWLGVPAGSVQTKGEGVGAPSYATAEARVKLIPAAPVWWSALFLDAPHELEVYCDVTTPSQWPHPGEVTMVDLDLDVCRRRKDAGIFVDDEDEFAEHQVRYAYPPDVIGRAAAAADWLQAALRAGAEPFRSDFLRWLDMVR